MKKSALAVAAAFTALVPAAYGQDYRYRDSSGDTARVISSTPVYETVGAREECWNPRARVYEERREGGRDSLANGTILGALAGGVLGHQVDSGTGGTLGGAILGGIIGNQIDRQHNSNDQSDLDLSRCRRIAGTTGNIQGYDVRYVYRGQEYQTRLSHDPGRRLRLGDDIRSDGTPRELVSSYSSPGYAPVYEPGWR
jgi:uncharacterized protein YcfJ